MKEILAHPVFSGISKNGATCLVNGSIVYHLESGDSLFKIFAPLHFLFIISGELAFYRIKSMPASAVTIEAGTWFGQCQISDDWIARLAFLKPHRLKLEITASCATVVIAVQEKKIKELPLQDQSCFIKNLDALTHRFIEHLVMTGMEFGMQSRRLQAHFISVVRRRHAEYQRSEMIQAILSGFPKLPLFAGKLIAMLQQEHATVNEIVQEAKLDPSLAGLILRLANSPYYNLPQKVTDFQHAVLLLGFNQICHMLLDSSIQSIMPKTAEFQKLRFDSVMISFLSFELAMSTNAVKPVTASTIGLLQSIGRCVLLLMKKQHPTAAILIDGLDHGKLGSSLLKTWNIPDLICMTIEYQKLTELCEPTTIPAECRSTSAILYLAGLCYQYLSGVSEQDMPAIFLGDYQRHLGLTAQPIASLITKHIKPGLLKRASTYPDNIRRFLSAVEERLG